MCGVDANITAGSTMAPLKELSVVVPTYEEALNVKPLCVRLFKATRAAGLTVELVFLDDDSGQGTIDTQRAVDELVCGDAAAPPLMRRFLPPSALAARGLAPAVARPSA